jgi:hypothetical protein
LFLGSVHYTVNDVEHSQELASLVNEAIYIIQADMIFGDGTAEIN